MVCRLYLKLLPLAFYFLGSSSLFSICSTNFYPFSLLIFSYRFVKPSPSLDLDFFIPSTSPTFLGAVIVVENFDVIGLFLLGDFTYYLYSVFVSMAPSPFASSVI